MSKQPAEPCRRILRKKRLLRQKPTAPKTVFVVFSVFHIWCRCRRSEMLELSAVLPGLRRRTHTEVLESRFSRRCRSCPNSVWQKKNYSRSIIGHYTRNFAVHCSHTTGEPSCARILIHYVELPARVKADERDNRGAQYICQVADYNARSSLSFPIALYNH